MTTTTNRFGELHTKWTSHKHPENPNFMQLVYWNVFEKDGKTTVCWHLGDAKRSNFIYGLTKDEAVSKFSDSTDAINETEYEQWLANKK